MATQILTMSPTHPHVEIRPKPANGRNSSGAVSQIVAPRRRAGPLVFINTSDLNTENEKQGNRRMVKKMAMLNRVGFGSASYNIRPVSLLCFSECWLHAPTWCLHTEVSVSLMGLSDGTRGLDDSYLLLRRECSSHGCSRLFSRCPSCFSRRSQVCSDDADAGNPSKQLDGQRARQPLR